LQKVEPNKRSRKEKSIKEKTLAQEKQEKNNSNPNFLAVDLNFLTVNLPPQEGVVYTATTNTKRKKSSTMQSGPCTPRPNSV
jgi:hypothetical protein